ncbi:MAG: heavy-metal-associated domain-containing protein [Pseudomonadota bacterium]
MYAKLQIIGMKDEQAAQTAEQALRQVHGVEHAQVNFREGTAEVEMAPHLSTQLLMRALGEAGFGAQPLAD